MHGAIDRIRVLWRRAVAAWPFVTKDRMLCEISSAKDRETRRVMALCREQLWKTERDEIRSTMRKLIDIEQVHSEFTDRVNLYMTFDARLFYSSKPNDREFVAREVAAYVESSLRRAVVLRPGVKL